MDSSDFLTVLSAGGLLYVAYKIGSQDPNMRVSNDVMYSNINAFTQIPGNASADLNAADTVAQLYALSNQDRYFSGYTNYMDAAVLLRAESLNAGVRQMAIDDIVRNNRRYGSGRIGSRDISVPF
jgi:hypothetical protein